MKLFLCSSYITPELKKDFEMFYGKSTDNLKVAFITTGSNPTPYDPSEGIKEDKDSIQIFNNWQIEDIDIAQLQGKRLEKKLSSVDVIWMNGGYTVYLLNEIRKSGLNKYLWKLLENGIIYIGSSTGSMVMSKTQTIPEWYPEEEEPGASKIQGLGLLNFEIFPHYENKTLKYILDNKDPNLEYYLLKNGQAISYNNGEIKTHGGDITILPKSI